MAADSQIQSTVWERFVSWDNVDHASESSSHFNPLMKAYVYDSMSFLNSKNITLSSYVDI